MTVLSPVLAELIAGLQVTLTILLPAQLLDRLAVLAALLLGRVAIPITFAKLALSVTTATAVFSIVMVAATFIRRAILVIIRILLPALALSFGTVVNIFALLMIEHIIMISFGLLVVLAVVVVSLGRISMAIANDWVHPQEFHL